MAILTITAGTLLLFCWLIVVAVLRLTKRRAAASYELLPGLLSPGETAFYRALHAAVAEDYLIVPKVRVADVLKVAGSVQRKRRMAAFSRIAMKHFDFVLCDSQTLAFVAAIELDDKSHNRRDRASRDGFLNAAAASANLPLHRFKARANYVVEEIRDTLMPPVVAAQIPAQGLRGRIEPTL